MIVDLTPKANEELLKVIETKNADKPLRIYVAGYGWGGPSFGIALDEHKDGDSKAIVGDMTFLLEEGLEETFSKFTIDYSDNWLKRGFTVIPEGLSDGSC